MAKNPVYGEIEYAVPGGSLSNPLNRGYADIVNLQNGNMFEIKPDNPDGRANGTSEVSNYIAKATINCPTSLPPGQVWNKGTNNASYSGTIIPVASSIPNQFLVGEIKVDFPGVIVYRYESNLNPQPLVIPQSVLEKFKELVQRLRNNLAISDKIIAEIVNQNPFLKNYIKDYAIQAGAAIVVGTLLEDILTGGTGIVDDWASFVLAHRIIRFALKL